MGQEGTPNSAIYKVKNLTEPAKLPGKNKSRSLKMLTGAISHVTHFFT